MEQDMKETNLLEEQTKVEEWLTEKNVDEQQEIQHSVVFYKHGANNMAEMSVENSNKLQMNAAWLKGIATGDTNLTSRFILHSEAGLVETYLLIRDTLNLQTIDESQEPLSVSNKNFAESSVKFKQRKNTKPLKEHKESMKRIKQPENWKVNLKKNARLKGEEYIGVGGKIVPAKKMGHPCVCRMHCAEKIDEKEREELHKSFWRIYTWQQRKQYIAKSVKESPKQRTRLRNNVQPERSSRCRQVTFTYSLLLKDEFITVCKSMFLSTFAISEKFVRHVMEKKRMSPSGIIEPDQRGRHTPKTKKSEDIKERVREHIRSFPSEKSTDPKDHSDRCYLDANLNIATMHKSYVSKCKQTGVPESDIVKESYYREMFKTEFNLGFKRVQAKEKKLMSNVS